MRVSTYNLVLLLSFFASVTLSHPSDHVLCTPPQSPLYTALVAKNSATFHQNFNKSNDVGKKANGALTNPSMWWTANNIETLGTPDFVAGLEAFDSPFPGLQIADFIHVNDGNGAAILYYFQGIQNGEYNGHPATGNKIEAPNGELLVFDSNALLTRLISVNGLDRIEAEVTGQVKINQFGTFPLQPNPPTPPSFRAKIKDLAASFTILFNARNFDAIGTLAASDVAIDSVSVPSSGRAAFIQHFRFFNTSFPDMLAHDEYILADGHYAATEFLWQGTREGDFTASNGTVVPPDGKSYQVRGMRWFKFNDEGLVTKFWEVYNNNDFLTQVQ